MRLIRIISKNKRYIVDAEVSLKLLGINFFTRTKSFVTAKDSINWRELPSKSKVSRKKEKKLNKWIQDHERFIPMASTR